MLSKSCPGAFLFKDPTPDYMDCPHCGQEMEIWSDEPIGRCDHCGLWVTRERGASCIDWCSHARECIGLDRYERLKRPRPPDADSIPA